MKIKYLIEGDDSPIRKTLDKLKKDTANAQSMAMKSATSAAEAGQKKQKETLAVINQQNTALKTTATATDVVNKKQQAVKNTIDQQTAAIQRQNAVAAKATVAVPRNDGKTVTNPSGGSTADILDRYSKRAADASNIHTAKIRSLNNEIATIANTGKTASNVAASSVAQVGGMASKAGGLLRGILQFIPGIGIATAVAFAIEPIMKWVAKLDLFGSKLSQSATNLAAFNDVNRTANQQAGEEIATLKILYKAATDVSESMKTRVAAAEQIKKTFPDQFANAKTSAILSGEEAAAFNATTEAILRQSRAKAAKEKIDAIESKLLDSEFQKSKIRNASRNERNRATRTVTGSGQSSMTGGGGVVVSRTKEQEQAIITAREETQIKLIDKNNEILEGEKKFLSKYVGQDQLVKSLLETPDKVKVKAAKSDPYPAALAKHQSMLDSMAKLTDDFNRKGEEKEDAEMSAISDRFAEMRRQLIEYNTWAINYNKKNKGNDVALIDLGALKPVEEAAIKNLEKQRADVTAKIEQEEQEKLLDRFVTYAQKRQLIEAEYLAKEVELRRLGYNDKADLAKEEGIEAANELDDQHTKQLGQFEKMLSDIDRMSVKEARKTIQAAKTLLAQKLKDKIISAAFAKEIEQSLDNATDTITQRLPDGLINVANAMDKIAGAVGDMDSGFANVLKLAASVTGELGNAFRSADAFSKAKKAGDIGGQIGAGMGMVGAGLAIVQTMNNFLDRETKADKERANSKAKELRSTEALTKALERQLSVADKAYGTKKLEEYKKAIDDANKAITDGSKSLGGRKALTGDKELDELIAKVNNGEKLKNWTLWGWTEKEIYDAAKKNLKGVTTDVKELQKLLDNGMLDANTAKIAQNFINAKDAIDQANNSMAEFVTATSFTSIADSIVDLFATGNAAAEDFGNNFEDIMKKAILNSFKTQSLATQLQGFYDKFAKNAGSDNALSEAEIAGLRAEYNKIIADSQQKFTELERVTGISFKPKEEGSESGLKGAIKRELTEQTASELTGLYRATYDLQKSTNGTLLEQRNLMSQKLAVLNVIAANTGATAANTAQLVRLEAMESSLATIVTNTKPGQTARSMGI